MQSDKPLRVLWFTNTPSLASKHLGVEVNSGGWISSLQEKVSVDPSICLGIGFQYGKIKLEKTVADNTTYYAIPNHRNKVEKVFQRHTHSISQKEDLDYYHSIIKDFKPDLIHIFGTERNYGMICKTSDIPVVIHLQGILSVYSTFWNIGGITKKKLLLNAGIKRIILGNNLYNEYFSFRNASIREKEIFRYCKHYMGRTAWDKGIISVSSPGSFYYHCDEILRKAFYSHQWDKKQESGKILFSTIQGNIYKGLDIILLTSELLNQKFGGNFEWRIAGVDKDEEAVTLWEKVKRKKFSENRVFFLGRMSVANLITELLSADLFIHPSYIDNSPNSVCEAMLLGMPVISTGSGGTSSLITDRQDGMLIHPGDPYGLTALVIELFSNPKFTYSLGKNARIKALERHDPGNILRQLFSIYEQVVQRTRNNGIV